MSYFVTSNLAIVVDVLFIIVVGVYLYWIWGLLRALTSDAPYVPMNAQVVDAIVAAAQAKSGSRWIDLGSGDGRVLIRAAERYGIIGVGIERIGALRVWSRFKIWQAGQGRAIKIRSGDFFDTDLSGYDVVSFYLLPVTAERLMPKLERELAPGTMVLFHRYPVPGLQLEYEDPKLKIYVARAPLLR